MPNWQHVRDCDAYHLSGCKPIHPNDWALAAKTVGSSRATELFEKGGYRQIVETNRIEARLFWGDREPISHGHPGGLRSRLVEQMASELFFPREKMTFLPIESLMRPKPAGILQSSSAGAYFHAIYKRIGLLHPPMKSHPVAADIASREAQALVDLCSNNTGDNIVTSRQIQDHILQRRELVYRNRLLMRQAVAVEPKVRSVFDGSFAGNIFLSVGSKPMSEYIKRGCHPQVYSLDALSHSNSWRGQFLSKDSGMGTILTFDIKKMDKSVLHSSTAAYCNTVADCFEESEGGLSRFGYSVASSTLLCKTSIETPWSEVWAPRSRQIFSGLDTVRDVESWLSVCGVLDTCLSVCVRSGELSVKQVIDYLFVLADDVGTYINPQHVTDFVQELLVSMGRYGLEVKDLDSNGIHFGNPDDFEFLGFSIKHRICVPDVSRLFSQLMWPERLLEGICPIAQMPTRARGISNLNRDIHPEITALCKAFSDRHPENVRTSKYNDFGSFLTGQLLATRHYGVPWLLSRDMVCPHRCLAGHHTRHYKQ